MGRLSDKSNGLWIGRVETSDLEDAGKFAAFSRFLILMGKGKEGYAAKRWSFRSLRRGSSADSVMTGNNVPKLRRIRKRSELN